MENILNNTASATGNYNDIPTTITSDVSTVTLLNGLTITKAADKQVWADGLLTYTLTIKNEEGVEYTNPVITDILDGTLVTFVPDSVTINGVKATSEQYTYNEETNTLTINLASIAASSTTTVTFQVTKKA